MFNHYFIILSAFLSLGATAATSLRRDVLRSESGNASFEMPEGWKAVQNLYGLPWTIVGPDRSPGDPKLKEDDQARRSVIAVIPTGKKDIIIDSASAEKSQTALFESRRVEIEKSDGEILERIPYTHETWLGGKADVHRIGIHFRQGVSRLTEVSYHIVCGRKLYMLKSMISDEDLKVDAPLVEKIVRSFQCE